MCLYSAVLFQFVEWGGGFGKNAPLLSLWSMSPILRARAPGIGVAGTKEPVWLGSSNSRPPQLSWKSIVNELF